MRYAARKIIMLVVTVLAISFVVFLAFSVIPGDPALTILGGQTDPARVEALREQMGLNAPLPVRYVRWLRSFLAGDFGMSYRYSVPVSRLLGEKIPITLILTLESFLFMLLISIPLGIYSARHAGGRADRALVILNQIIMAVPPFFSGILITFFFGMLLHWFVPGGYVSWRVSLSGCVGYLVFPAIAIALPKSAMVVSILRRSLLKEARLDYVRTAYSRGSRTNYVLYRHMLRNAMGPVVTFLGMAAADMVAGSIIIEQVFGIPGLGRALLTAIANRDYPVVEAIIVLISVLVVASGAAVDLICRRLDPRISLD
ncbi:ABC transporter permease [Lachnoclostridium sp. Marseille-P6806]|uniref:ABC transporter permease n=1 Tax=Lachnoclostridium sp. Marseille-P6806 TaxID=2364793 RepID=UPI0010308062|nr:ABC transporter permease [Lachnoclostridium sp. Marseille-P6806]